MDMNIQKYMAFVKTVEYGSFTKAAEILNYSQSGISRMINDLEKEWKVVLLETVSYTHLEWKKISFPALC